MTDRNRLQKLKLFAILSLNIFAFTALAAEGEFIPGSMSRYEQATLVGPAVPDVGFCLEGGIQMDWGWTQTGGLVFKTKEGKTLEIDLSVPLTLQADAEAPIDEPSKQKAGLLCTTLKNSIGKTVSLVVQNFSQSDDGEILKGLYLRELRIPEMNYSFSNFSEIYVRLPKKK